MTENVITSQQDLKPNPDPRFEALLKRANDLFTQRELTTAKKIYEDLLKERPQDFRVLSGLGALSINQQDFDNAIKYLEASLAINSKQVHVLSNLSVALMRKNKHQESLERADQAILLNPKFPDAHINRGQALSKLERLDDALVATSKGIELNPRNSNSYNLRAVLYQNLNRFEESLADYDQAIRLSRDQVSAYFNKGYLKLLMGDFEQGWRLFEWRWKGLLKKFFRNFPQPLWTGNFSIEGKTILITQEQGFGDFIQFSRYIPMVTALGAKVIVECSPAVKKLAESLGPNITTTEKKKPLPPFDAYCPILSLPLAFSTSLDNVPHQVPYLFVDKETQDKAKLSLGPKEKIRVGLVWSGSKNTEIDSGFWRRRSVSLKTLDPILKFPFDYYVIQKDMDAQDIEDLKLYPQIKARQGEVLDFTDTAALINEMDLIISVDTASGHLAGALGKKLWMLIPFAHDYRWLIDRTDSPWYPTAVLFRQKSPGDWSNVLDEISQNLSQLT